MAFEIINSYKKDQSANVAVTLYGDDESCCIPARKLDFRCT